MSRGLLLGSVVVAAAAGAGYWLFGSTARHAERPIAPGLAAAGESARPGAEPPQLYYADNSAEVIDLSRVFEPTGQELDVQNLLDATAGPEPLPLPRTVDVGGDNLLSRQAAFFVSRKCAEMLCGSLPLTGSTARGGD